MSKKSNLMKHKRNGEDDRTRRQAIEFIAGPHDGHRAQPITHYE